MGIFRAFGDKESTVHTGGLLHHFIFYSTLIGFFKPFYVFLVSFLNEKYGPGPFDYQNELEKAFFHEVLSLVA